MIIFEKEKCSRCGLCMKDCLGGTIVRDEAGYPTIPEPEFCIDCGHYYPASAEFLTFVYFFFLIIKCL